MCIWAHACIYSKYMQTREAQTEILHLNLRMCVSIYDVRGQYARSTQRHACTAVADFTMPSSCADERVQTENNNGRNTSSVALCFVCVYFYDALCGGGDVVAECHLAQRKIRGRESADLENVQLIKCREETRARARARTPRSTEAHRRRRLFLTRDVHMCVVCVCTQAYRVIRVRGVGGCINTEFLVCLFCFSTAHRDAHFVRPRECDYFWKTMGSRCVCQRHGASKQCDIALAKFKCQSVIKKPVQCIIMQCMHDTIGAWRFFCDYFRMSYAREWWPRSPCTCNDLRHMWISMWLSSRDRNDTLACPREIATLR